MRYNKIREMDISDGPGVRVSIFFQGCTFNCKNCFNKETHDFNTGKEFNDDTIEEILKISQSPNIKGLSILGGEPLHPINLPGSTKLAKAFKERFPEKNIWVWSGFTFENYISKQEICNYIDVVVDGLYVDELRNPKLMYRGSTNQRIIDVPNSINKNEVVIFEDYIK